MFAFVRHARFDPEKTGKAQLTVKATKMGRVAHIVFYRSNNIEFLLVDNCNFDDKRTFINVLEDCTESNITDLALKAFNSGQACDLSRAISDIKGFVKYSEDHNPPGANNETVIGAAFINKMFGLASIGEDYEIRPGDEEEASGFLSALHDVYGSRVQLYGYED